MRTLRTKNSLTLLVRFVCSFKSLRKFWSWHPSLIFCSCMPQVLTTHPWLLAWSGQLIKPKPLKDLVVTVQLSPPWFSGTYFSHTVKAEIWNWREDLSICPRPNSPASVKDLHFPNRWSGIVAYMILNYIRTLFWISLKCGRMSQCWFWDAVAYTMLWLFRPFFRFRMFGSFPAFSFKECDATWFGPCSSDLLQPCHFSRRPGKLLQVSSRFLRKAPSSSHPPAPFCYKISRASCGIIS